MKRILFFVVFGMLPSCGDQPQQTPLLGDIPSQLSPNEVRKSIKLEQKDWVTVDENIAKGNEKRPPFGVLTIAVREHKSLGESGEARFYFFNNQLMATAFYPRNIDGYKKKLEEEKRVKFELRSASFLSRILHSLFGVRLEDLEGRAVLETHLAPKTRVQLLKDYRDKDNFYFEDEYIAEKHDQWIRDHS